MKVCTSADLAGLGLVTDLVTAGAVLGIGRTKSHELARRGEFPVPIFKVGNTWRVPIAGLRSLLGLPMTDSSVAGPASPAVATTEHEPLEARDHDESRIRSIRRGSSSGFPAA